MKMTMNKISLALVWCGALVLVALGCGSSGGSGGPAGNWGAGGGASGGTTGTGGAVVVPIPFSSGTGGCAFTGTYAVSPMISTVGIVTFTTVLPAPTEAHINFGLDTSYGMTAPVDLTQPSYRTLLLGMKPSKQYHFQLSATSATDGG